MTLLISHDMLIQKSRYQASPLNLISIDIFIERQQCELMGFFGVTVQILLGLLSFSILLLKQTNEQTRRDWKVWFMDTSKQGIGSIYIHAVNVMISTYLTSLQTRSETSECNCSIKIYFIELSQSPYIFQCNLIVLNLKKDFLLGNMLNFLIVSFAKKMNQKLQLSALSFGQYNSHTAYQDYYPQLLAWIIVITISKIILLGNIFIFSGFYHWLGDNLLVSLKDYPRFLLILVVVIIPVFLNTISYWTTDNYLCCQDSQKSKQYLILPKEYNEQGNEENKSYNFCERDELIICKDTENQYD